MSTSSQDKTGTAAASVEPVEDAKAESTTTVTPSTILVANDNGAAKRPEECADAPAAKRLRHGTNDTKDDDTKQDDDEPVMIDLCDQLGLKAGDRLEVEWQLVLDGEEDDDSVTNSGDDDDEEEEEKEGKTTTKWWGCSLLPHDGRYDDGVAVRTLEYDPSLPHYPEKTREDVIFLSHEIIINPSTQAEFRFRPEDVIQFNCEEETREAINGILMETLNKHSAKWAQLDRAQQGAIAAVIAQKKELLVEAIMSHSKSPIINADDMKEILQGVMRK
jgi:hypothetical protein